MTDTSKSVSTAASDLTKPASVAVKPLATSTTNAAKKAESAEKKTEAPVKKAADKKPAAKKTAAKKPVAKKTSTKKAAAKKTTKKTSRKAAVKMESAVFVQYDEKNINSEELVSRVKEIWKSKKKRVSDLADIKVYLNVAESRAYYVVNGDTFGAFEI